MAKKQSTRSIICRNIQIAFQRAEAGNEKVAKQLWQEAINLGYVPGPRTARGFEIAIEKGQRLNASRDTLRQRSGGK